MTQNTTKPRRWSKKKTAAILFVIGNLIPVCYVLWMCFVAPPPIEISEETTVITEPLTADGRYVDYFKHTKGLIGEHDHRDDLWKALVSPNRPNDESSEWAIGRAPCVTYRDPREVLRPDLESWEAQSQGRARYEARCAIPFSEDTDPDYGKIVRQNESWYHAVMTTEPGPVAVDWSGSDIHGIGLPMTDVHWVLNSRFLLRLSLALGEQDCERAFETFRFIQKIARRETSLPFWVCSSSAQRLERRGLQTICAGLLGAKAIPEPVLRKIDSLSPAFDSIVVFRKSLEFDRFSWPSLLYETHRSRGMTGDYTHYGTHFGWPAGNWFVRRIDFESALRLNKRVFDAGIPAFEIADAQQSFKALKELSVQFSRDWPTPKLDPDNPTLTELATGDHNAWIHSRIAEFWLFKRSRSSVASFDNAWKRLRISVRLHVYRTRFGKWPDTLNELTQLEGWETNEDIIIDDLTGETFKYRPDGDGFVLSSVGPDKIDQTASLSLDSSKDSWEYGVGDDVVWPWPDPRYQWQPDPEEGE